MRDEANRPIGGGETRNELSGSANIVLQAGTIAGGVRVRSASDLPVPRQLPPTPGRFIGRNAQIRELDDALIPDTTSGPPAIVLSGTAGAGKTTLALHWAHRASSKFPDGQLYVDLRGFSSNHPVDPAEAVAGFLRALGVPPAEVPAGLGERTALFRSLIAGRRILTVLDNACSEDQVRPLLPADPSCTVLVTSRRILSGLAMTEGAGIVDVGLLDVPEASDLLRSLIGTRIDEDAGATEALIGSCALLPLALRVAAQALCLHPSKSVAELVDDLTERETQLDPLGDDDPSTSARRVFSWSYDHLDSRAARLYRLLGVYPGHDFDVHTVAALLDTPTKDAKRALDALVRAHLVMDVGHGRFDMHDLLRAYASELADQRDTDRAAGLRRLFDYYLHAADQADRVLTPHRYRVPLDGEARPAPSMTDHHSALTWLDAERPNMTAIFRVTAPELDTRLWQLAYTLRGYYFLTKQWHDWTHTHELALEATQRTGDRYAEAQTRNNLGLALLEQGQWDRAADHYDEARVLFESVGDIHGVSNALANRATVLHYRGDLEAALQENERALACYERTGSRRNTAITLRSMALIDVDLGRFETATQRLSRAMKLFTDLGLDLDLAMALNCLGEAQHQTGDGERAEQAHLQALTVSNSCGSRFESARARHGVGRAAARRGRYAEAVNNWEKALAEYTSLGAGEAQQLEDELASLRREKAAELSSLPAGVHGYPDESSDRRSV